MIAEPTGSPDDSFHRFKKADSQENENGTDLKIDESFFSTSNNAETNQETEKLSNELNTRADSLLGLNPETNNEEEATKEIEDENEIVNEKTPDSNNNEEEDTNEKTPDSNNNENISNNDNEIQKTENIESFDQGEEESEPNVDKNNQETPDNNNNEHEDPGNNNEDPGDNNEYVPNDNNPEVDVQIQDDNLTQETPLI